MTACRFVGCTRPALARGYCSGHYAQFRRGSALHALGAPRGSRGERIRLTVRVSDHALAALRSEGHPATVASRWIEEQARR